MVAGSVKAVKLILASLQQASGKRDTKRLFPSTLSISLLTQFLLRVKSRVAQTHVVCGSAAFPGSASWQHECSFSTMEQLPQTGTQRRSALQVQLSGCLFWQANETETSDNRCG